jgi:hypothetical protein
MRIPACEISTIPIKIEWAGTAHNSIEKTFSEYLVGNVFMH